MHRQSEYYDGEKTGNAISLRWQFYIVIKLIINNEKKKSMTESQQYEM